MSSLRAVELCPRCSGTSIGVFPCVTLGCSDGKGSIRMNTIAMSLYTCGDCGFSEMYLRQPVLSWKKTPEEHSMEFEWVRAPTDAPYR